METYSSFSAKKEIFIQTKVQDINDLKQELAGFNLQVGTPMTKRFFFRGASNSSFKIYSSIQRCYFKRNENGNDISMLELSNEVFSRFNNNLILADAFNKEVPQPSSNSNLAKWAFIQHFGGPSHFVDFTTDINIALFFALSDPKEEAYNADDEDLNNYFSIYVYPDNPSKNGNLNILYESSSQQGRDLVLDFLEQHPEERLDTIDSDRQLTTQPLDNAFWGASVYGGDLFQLTSLGNGHKSKMTLNNSHIAKQKGNFFQGNIIDAIPLELAHNLRGNDMGNKCYYPYGHCLDIHKSLIPAIRQNFSIPTENEIYTPKDYMAGAKHELKSLWEPNKNQ